MGSSGGIRRSPKKILVGWEFHPSCILWDIEGAENTLKIKNVVKVIVIVVDGKLHCEWEQSWKERVGFMTSLELQELLTRLGAMVTGAGTGTGTGKCMFE